MKSEMSNSSHAPYLLHMANNLHGFIDPVQTNAAEETATIGSDTYENNYYTTSTSDNYYLSNLNNNNNYYTSSVSGINNGSSISYHQDYNNISFFNENGTCVEPFMNESIQINWLHETPPLVVYCLTYVIGVAGNCLIIFTIASYKKMKSTINVFLASLASADLLFILICIPIKVSFFFLTIVSLNPSNNQIGH